MEKRLLIIDDNKEIVEVAGEILLDLFDVVESANTVDQAISLLQNQTYSFIVLDINLEGRNGAEVIKYLVENPENSNKEVPFVIISGMITPQFVERNRQRFAGILMKPFAHNELRVIVENNLNGVKVETEAVPAGPTIDEIPYLKCNLPFPIIQLEQRVNKVLDQVRKSSKLKQLFSDLKIDRTGDNYIITHIGMLINIATGICIQMEWNTDKTLEKFVYAAYLHDMALSERPDLAKITTFAQLESLKDKLSAVDYKLVFEHPNIAARSIDNMREIPQDVQLIIKQHHELPKEDGFPAKCSFQKITPLSTVFIIAHDLTEFILANQKWTMEDYIKKSKSKFKGIHFSKILSSLSDIK
jgi:response regulator RpfG family c-di-GMP phosphodiesterase